MNREELVKLEKEEIISVLFAIIQQQAAIIQQQADMIQQLTEKNAELEARINQNSRNSSKPPSTDGYRKQSKSLRKPSGKKVGGQQGHKGSGLKLTHKADIYVRHDPNECACCPNVGECHANRTVCETRYEIDIDIKPITTAHQSVQVECPRTAKTLVGSFPKGINSTMQYGVNLKALIVALSTDGMVSINRTHEILSGVFDIPVSTGTIAETVSECAKKVADTVEQIKENITKKPLINVDETGIRVEKKTFWAHTASTEDMTYIEVQQGRGKAAMDKIGILLTFVGTVIHDCWASYFLFGNIRHGLCNAHLLRELTAVLENTKQTWAQALIDLLRMMKKVKEKLILKGCDEAPAYYHNRFSLIYDKILTEALAQNPVPERDASKKGRPKRGKTGALVDRLIHHKDEYLLFFTDFSVPFDNNLAERSFRMFKVKQKVAGCFRTVGGANDFAAIMSYTGTARKRGISAFHAIKDALLGNHFSLFLTGAN